MSTHATGTIETKTWGDQPYDESEGLPKLSRGSMTESFHGDIVKNGGRCPQIIGLKSPLITV